jgi:hypothetical protein
LRLQKKSIFSKVFLQKRRQKKVAVMSESSKRKKAKKKEKGREMRFWRKLSTPKQEPFEHVVSKERSGSFYQSQLACDQYRSI